MRLPLRRWGVAVLGLFFLVSAPRAEEGEAPGAALPTVDETKLKQLWDEGVDLFNAAVLERDTTKAQDLYAKARDKFREIVAGSPSDEMAHRLVQRAGARALVAMMTDKHIGVEVQKVWDLYRHYKQRLTRDPRRIKEAAEAAVNPALDAETRWRHQKELREIGPYAVPYLAKYLEQGRTDEEKCALARTALTVIGPRAVPVLGPLLSHDNALVKENVAYILAEVQPPDARGIAWLKRVLEREGEEANVRKRAEQALEVLTGLRPAEIKSSAELFYLQADRYYREMPSVSQEGLESDYLVWHLGPDQELRFIQYPSYAWNEEMAEELCYQAYASDPAYERPIPLLVSAFVAQYEEARYFQEIVARTPQLAEGRPSDFTISVQDAATVAERLKAVQDNLLLANAAGTVHQYRALGKSLKDRKPLVASALTVMLAVSDPDGKYLPRAPEPEDEGRRRRRRDAEAAPAAEGATLIQALDDPDERIAYAAAIALAKIDPAFDFPGADRVVSTLARAVGESGPLQILLVSEDAREAADFKEKLMKLGWGVTVADSGRDAFGKAVAFPPHDVFIVSTALQKDLKTRRTEEKEPPQLLERLAEDARTKFVPVGLLTTAQRRDADVGAFGEKLPLLARELEGNDLQDAIQKLAVTRSLPVLTKYNKNRVAIAAAKALNEIDPVRTKTRPADCAEACIRALDRTGPEAEDLINPCIRALGLHRIAAGRERVTSLYHEKGRPFKDGLTVRNNCLWALGRLAPEESGGLFLEIAKNKADEFSSRLLGAEGYGQGDQTTKKVLPFHTAVRVDKEKKEQ